MSVASHRDPLDSTLLALPVGVSKQSFVELAGLGPGHLVAKVQGSGNLVSGKTHPTVLTQGLAQRLTLLMPRSQLDDRLHLFAKLGIRPANDSHILDSRRRSKACFDLGGIDMDPSLIPL